MFTAFWCCSVGMTWTLELRPVDRADRAVLGRPAEWIGSGVPTQQPAPEPTDLLRTQDLLLFPAGPNDPALRSRSRILIGYVTRDPEVMRLALIVAGALEPECDHPMALASRWVQAGYSPGEAARWVKAGAISPAELQAMLNTELDAPDLSEWSELT
ncbi:MAG: hypothetical protein ACRDSH_16115 [Pseudonocardiaceae bacterium]